MELSATRLPNLRTPMETMGGKVWLGRIKKAEKGKKEREGSRQACVFFAFLYESSTSKCIERSSRYEICSKIFSHEGEREREKE